MRFGEWMNANEAKVLSFFFWNESVVQWWRSTFHMSKFILLYCHLNEKTLAHFSSINLFAESFGFFGWFSLSRRWFFISKYQTNHIHKTYLFFIGKSQSLRRRKKKNECLTCSIDSYEAVKCVSNSINIFGLQEKKNQLINRLFHHTIWQAYDWHNIFLNEKVI